VTLCGRSCSLRPGATPRRRLAAAGGVETRKPGVGGAVLEDQRDGLVESRWAVRVSPRSERPFAVAPARTLPAAAHPPERRPAVDAFDLGVSLECVRDAVGLVSQVDINVCDEHLIFIVDALRAPLS
jgi:hypothetical protein